jgi:hypothetical protein
LVIVRRPTKDKTRPVAYYANDARE